MMLVQLTFIHLSNQCLSNGCHLYVCLINVCPLNVCRTNIHKSDIFLTKVCHLDVSLANIHPPEASGTHVLSTQTTFCPTKHLFSQTFVQPNIGQTQYYHTYCQTLFFYNPEFHSNEHLLISQYLFNNIR